MAGKALKEWNNDDVAYFLSNIGFNDDVVDTFKSNGVTGKDLQAMSADELHEDLSCSKFQAKKIVRELQPYKDDKSSSSDEENKSENVQAQNRQPQQYSYVPAAAAAPAPTPIAQPPPAGYPGAAATSSVYVAAQVHSVNKQQYQQALQWMSNADKSLKEALGALGKAKGAGAVDTLSNFRMRPGRPGRGIGIGQNGPVDMMADVAKKGAMRTADGLVKNASRDILQAKQLVPEMPNIQEGQVKGLNMMFGDVIFDNMLSDMKAMQKIQRSMAEIEKMERDVHYACRWLQTKISE